VSDLAYNINGESFEVPATATGWRVRRMKPRGAPEVVFGRDGVPLTVPIESDLEELRRSVDAPGRFRLDAVDERGRTIEDAPAAYVMVSSRLDPAAAPPMATALATYQTPDSLVAEAMRHNTELARSVIDRFPEMMHAAAELLRAADGAGLPARAPRVVDRSDDDDDSEEANPAQAPSGSPLFEILNTVIAQLVPIIVTSVANKAMPKLPAILDWRKAEPKTSKVTTEDHGPSEPSTDGSIELPPLDPKAIAHFIAIQSVLTPAEAALARQVAADLSPAEVRTWLAELTALSVPDAVAKIRSFVGSTPKAGGAS
jgi:hypothetical protein